MIGDWDKICDEAVERLIARHQKEYRELQKLCKHEFKRHGDFSQ